jgi:hypothetical protein
MEEKKMEILVELGMEVECMVERSCLRGGGN